MLFWLFLRQIIHGFVGYWFSWKSFSYYLVNFWSLICFLKVTIWLSAHLEFVLIYLTFALKLSNSMRLFRLRWELNCDLFVVVSLDRNRFILLARRLTWRIGWVRRVWWLFLFSHLGRIRFVPFGTFLDLKFNFWTTTTLLRTFDDQFFLFYLFNFFSILIGDITINNWSLLENLSWFFFG